MQHCLAQSRPMPYRAKSPCVYILASLRNGTLYIGVTSDLAQRVALHKQDLIEGFTKKYRVEMRTSRLDPEPLQLVADVFPRRIER